MEKKYTPKKCSRKKKVSQSQQQQQSWILMNKNVIQLFQSIKGILACYTFQQVVLARADFTTSIYKFFLFCCAVLLFREFR